MSTYQAVPEQTSGEIEDPNEDVNYSSLSCLESFKFFIKHSFKDIKRRKCHFCLAYCSVFITVLATLVVNTVIDKGPIIFLSLNQEKTGEIDSLILPESDFNNDLN